MTKFRASHVPGPNVRTLSYAANTNGSPGFRESVFLAGEIRAAWQPVSNPGCVTPFPQHPFPLCSNFSVSAEPPPTD